MIGGGITGLTSAFYLLRRFPTTPITIFEKSPRVGGWINSRRVAVKDEQGRSANMLLETGPRTLRPSSSGAVLELVSINTGPDQSIDEAKFVERYRSISLILSLLLLLFHERLLLQGVVW